MSSWPQEPILLSDPRILAIPVVELDEPLVCLACHGEVSVASLGPTPPFGLPAPDGAAVHGLVRASLAVRLGRASRALRHGMQLHVVEGYRPMSAQRRFFAAYVRQLMQREPRLNDRERERLASRFVAPPEVAAHPSGAAVDITLVDRHGRPLDMGTPIDATPEQSSGACYLEATGIDPTVRTRRRQLAEVLEDEGLVNYPTEWWHWSFGDRYWAHATGSTSAMYGQVEWMRSHSHAAAD